MDQPARPFLGNGRPPGVGVSDLAWEASSPGSYFDAQTVVSRDAQRQPVSHYGDDCWDYRSLSTDGTSGATLHFFAADGDADPQLAALLREQHKALVWLYIDAGVGGGLKTRFFGGHDALFDPHRHRLADAWRCTPARGQRGRRLQGPASGLRKGDRGLVDGAGIPGARRA